MGYWKLSAADRATIIDALSELDRRVLQGFIDETEDPNSGLNTGVGVTRSIGAPAFISETITARLASLGLIDVDKDADRTVAIRNRNAKATAKGTAILRFAQTGEWS